MEWLEGISVVIASAVAIYGINAWRREHVGTRRVELAEDTLALFYEASDVVRGIRNPGSFGTETAHIERAADETDEAYTARRNASIVFVRYDKNKELFNKIYAARYRFMAQFGKDKAVPFDELHRITVEIFAAARALARLWRRDNFRTDEQFRRHNDQINRHEAVFWEGSAEDDPINPRLDRVITQIEAICRKEIETWETGLWRRAWEKLRTLSS